MSALESAIPAEWRRERTCPLTMKAEWTPPYPSYSARFALSRTALTMLILGVQTPDEEGARDSVHEHCRLFTAVIDDAEDVAFRDQSEFTDQAGMTSRMIICYFDEESRRAADHLRVRWMQASEARPDWGFFSEEIHPSFDRVETLYSSGHVQGVGHLADSLSGEVREHGYWGSARDRMPGAQRNRLEPDPGVIDAVPGGVLVHGIENLCLIRSGQDWSETSGEERMMYLDEVEPALRAGMDYLSAEGTEIGCITNRYARVLDASGHQLDQSFGLSWWRSLADLEAWSRDHPTHKAIFGAAMRYLGEHGGSGHLKLTHEVFVVKRAQGRFEYRNCRPETGLLASR